MDKYFEPINKIYLSQTFAETVDEDKLEECLHVAMVYAETERAIVSMGDSIRNCSYCFYGGLADVLGLSMEERRDIIPSLYEDFVFSRADMEDLAHRHAHELAFIHYTRLMNADERKDYVLSDMIRIRDKMGEWRQVRHRMFPLAGTSDGSYWLNMCVYTLCHDSPDTAKIVNMHTGECRILTNNDYENILSPRERAVLQLIGDGCLSKEIASRLYISINTVNRHRQNILQKLKVGNAIEACKVARAMGLLS
ncbi:MAG: LuxR C-terminal-related transcriptional regulator [Prevotellaceae bacterium]|nr:LuxR C-terminal-related transcriptional regulator [Prevotellaceae bacterium]MDO4932881.1 LuxR C-terminal-related transcriptional regulator [Prevotellaceae bacterium]